MTRREKKAVWAFGLFLFLALWGMLLWVGSDAKHERLALDCRIDALEQGTINAYGSGINETCDR